MLGVDDIVLRDGVLLYDVDRTVMSLDVDNGLVRIGEKVVEDVLLLLDRLLVVSSGGVLADWELFALVLALVVGFELAVMGS